MSLLSAVILPMVEEQLAGQAPEVAQFAINQLANIAAEIMQYVEQKAAAAQPQVATQPAAAPVAG